MAPAGRADTFPKLLVRNAEIFRGRPAFRLKDFGIWQTWTWEQVLAEVRGLAGRFASESKLGPSRSANFVLAANEIATNSVVHGGGKGSFRIWQDAVALSCEVRDAGHFDKPLVDRDIAGADAYGSRGLWLANQLCDLVQIRTLPDGTVVRLHMRRKASHDQETAANN